MALASSSLFLYGFQITQNNRFFDFKNAALGPQLTGTLNIGYYNLTTLMAEVIRAIGVVDSTNTYSVTADRTFSGGTQNRVTIATNGSFLSLLFGSGTHASASPATLLGFTATDKTGFTTYTGSTTAGTAFTTNMAAYNYLGPNNLRKVFGAVNVAASGAKEAIVFQIQQFIEATFKYETAASITASWQPFMTWAIQQRPFDYTPEILVPTIFFSVTMEKTSEDGSALAYRMTEMLSENFPNTYTTNGLTMRIIQ